MKVTIESGYEYARGGTPAIEIFDLTVEGEISDPPKEVANTYLSLRGILRKGIEKKEED